MGADLPRAGAEPEKPVPDDRFDSGSGSSAGGHGPQKRGDKALGRSRGGLTTKIHLLVNELGLPLDFRITAGQISDYTPAVELLGEHKAEAVIADKGYDSHKIVDAHATR
jgi:hypothetical protein